MSDELALSLKAANQLQDLEQLGFSNADLAALIRKHGEAVLQLIADGLEKGLDKEFIMKALVLFGPILLDLMNSFLAEKQKVGVRIIEGEEVQEFKEDGQILIDTLIKKFLPILMEKIGPKLIDWVVQMLLKALAK